MMALDAVIFDIDGTLIDSNPAHVEAWVQAFAARGYRVAADRITVEIGKGGDKLVPSILGAEADRRDGDALREAQKEAFLALARRTKLPVFPGAEELITELRRRGMKTALATSSGGEQLDGLFRSAGVDFRKLVDEATSADDAKESKPAPDILQAAIVKLGLAPTQCAMVGDTVYDAEASRGAGVACLGVRSGGNAAETLMRAGARAVWRDTADLHDHLEQALGVAAPGPVPVDRPMMERLMREALAAAREGLAAGEVPIGAVLARGDGTVIARGFDRMMASRVRTAHAEIAAFTAAAGAFPAGARDLLLVSTLEPCVMCTGAAMETAVDIIIFGLGAPADAGTGRVQPPRSPDNGMPRIVGGILAAESRALLEEWMRSNGNPEQRPYVEQLLQHPFMERGL